MLDYTCLRQNCESRLEGFRRERELFWQHWAALAEMFLPRRYRWLVTANQMKGNQINQSIIDETGVIAARICAAGMMSGLTSPIRPWFKLGLSDLAYLDFGPGRVWLADCERRMMRVLSESNFYQGLGTLYLDNVVFSSASMTIYEDPEEVIRCYNPMLGEFFFGSSARWDVDSQYREFALTTIQIVEEFGLDKASAQVRENFRQGGGQLQQEIVVCHAIEPNYPIFDRGSATKVESPVPEAFPYRECYWEKGSPANSALRVDGFYEKPFVGARWDVASNEAYGRGIGMDAMPATRQLQQEQKRKGEALDKMVRPPMVGSVSMRNEPNSILPGAMNYVSDLQGAGFKPAFLIDPRIMELSQDIKEVQERIKTIFYNDLFLMISSLDTVRTATEIDARKEEKLIQLGPVIERFQNEVLDPIILRVFSIMHRKGLFLPPPPEIEGVGLNVQYTSMLQAAQKAAATSGIERWLGVGGNLAGVDASIMDNYDLDAVVKRYADDMEIDPNLVRPADQVAAIRAQRAKAQQQQALMQTTLAGAEGAKTLSQTDVGGGKNALESMIS